MSATDPAQTQEFNLAMYERIIAMGAVPLASDLFAPTACNILHRQLIALLGTAGAGWAANARQVTAAGDVAINAATDDGMFVDVNANGAPRNIVLPANATLRTGWNCVIRKADSVQANALTLVFSGGDAGSGPNAINGQFEAMFVVKLANGLWATFTASPDTGDLGWASNERAVSGDATILATSDDGMAIDQNANGAPRVANLPSALVLRQGFNFTLRKADAVTTDTITLTPNGADTISGPTVISSQFAGLLVCRTGPTTWLSIAIGATVPVTSNVQEFTTPGPDTWTKPTNFTPTTVEVICIGGGGGGGGGSSGTGASARGGGAGGGGGAYSRKVFRASELGVTEAVNVGAPGTAGTGGAGGGLNDGTDGGNGGNSTFGTVVRLFAGGGGGGRRGTAAAGNPTCTGGGGGSGAQAGTLGAAASPALGGLPGGASSVLSKSGGQGGDGLGQSFSAGCHAEYGGAGGAGSNATPGPINPGTSLYGGGGGGCGGGATVAPAVVNPTAGGASGTYIAAGGGGGAAGVSGAAPTPGTAGAAGSTLNAGFGGGGGGSSVTAGVAGAAGGAGGAAGGGGGGGGCGEGAGAGALGGAGGRGLVIVFCW